MSSWPLAKRLLTSRGVLIVLTALALLAATGVHANSPDGNLRGYPWSYTAAVSPCYQPNPFNGCGSTIDPLGLSLDLAFWVLVSLAVVSGTALLFRRMHTPPCR